MEATKMRSTWDLYFMQIATQVATRSTCNRKHVGAVIVRDRYILTTGYNGSISGLDHCDDVGHLYDPDDEHHCLRTVHAEANAIAQAARNGVALNEGTIYVTAFPCFLCFKLIASAGIQHIVYKESYKVDQKVLDMALQLGLAVDVLEP